MRAMNEAIEGARDFQGFMEKVIADEKRLVQQVAGLPPRTEPTTPHDGMRYTVLPGRQPGENRAAHRARLKRERREANKARA
jgi:hypothetical protein